MRPTRAYLAGIGTASSLLAGAAIVFVLAGTLVAVHGWPQITAGGTPSAIVVPTTPAVGHVRLARQVLAAFRKTAHGKPAVVAGRAGGHAGHAAPGAGTGAAGAGTSRPTSGGGGTGHGTVPVSPHGGGGTKKGTPPVPPVKIPSAPGGVGTTVSKTESAVSKTVSAIGKKLGKTLTGLPQSLGGTPTHLGRRLG